MDTDHKKQPVIAVSMQFARHLEQVTLAGLRHRMPLLDGTPTMTMPTSELSVRMWAVREKRAKEMRPAISS
jgi:hypothetical protein